MDNRVVMNKGGAGLSEVDFVLWLHGFQILAHAAVLGGFCAASV